MRCEWHKPSQRPLPWVWPFLFVVARVCRPLPARVSSCSLCALEVPLDPVRPAASPPQLTADLEARPSQSSRRRVDGRLCVLGGDLTHHTASPSPALLTRSPYFDMYVARNRRSQG